jgi:ferredoxin
MGTGPRARAGFDLALTEIERDGFHQFLVETGSERGARMLSELPHRGAEETEVAEADTLLRQAASSMTKSVDTSALVGMLEDRFDDTRWDDVAKRCLACANCTMVCPTCFCTTVEDITSLSGEEAERRRVWDSCFTTDFTRIAGGIIRNSTRSRYRQWLMHKFAHWQGQFNMIGCVGCGRCITWCPAGIDITEELRCLRESSASSHSV